MVQSQFQDEQDGVVGVFGPMPLELGDSGNYVLAERGIRTPDEVLAPITV